jgi:hypothetical protein
LKETGEETASSVSQILATVAGKNDHPQSPFGFEDAGQRSVIFQTLTDDAVS